MNREPCLVCQKLTDYEPEMCCSGTIQDECGCMGQPLEPCVCSQECFDELLNEKKENKGA